MRHPLTAAVAAAVLAPIVAAFLAEHVAGKVLIGSTIAAIAVAAFAGTLITVQVARRRRGAPDPYWLSLQTSGLVAAAGVVLAGG